MGEPGKSEKMRKDTVYSVCRIRKNYNMPCKTCVLYETPQCPEKTMIKNCMKCPQNAECDYTVCNLRYATGACLNESCDLLKNDKLAGLPDYCHLKDVTPSNCPVLTKKHGAKP